MAKKQKGLADFLPPDWDDWTQDEKDEWFTYPDEEKEKRRKRRKRRKKGSASGYMWGSGMLPKIS